MGPSWGPQLAHHVVWGMWEKVPRPEAAASQILEQ